MNKPSRDSTWLVIGGLIGAVSITMFLCCGSIGFVVYRQVAHSRETQRKNQEAMEIQRAAKHAEWDEKKRQELLNSAEMTVNTVRNQFHSERDSKFEPHSAFDRAARENPESFEREIRLREQYLKKLADAKTVEEFRQIQAEQDQQVVVIRTERYRAALESLRAKIAEKLPDTDGGTYYAIQIVPRLHAAANFQLAMASFTTLGFAQEYWRKEMIQKWDQPRVAIIRKKAVAVEYVVQSIFAMNDHNGIADTVCKWELVTTSEDKQVAMEAATKAAMQWNETVDDPREMAVLSLSSEE